MISLDNKIDHYHVNDEKRGGSIGHQLKQGTSCEAMSMAISIERLIAKCP